jgi:hypothetical protein
MILKKYKTKSLILENMEPILLCEHCGNKTRQTIIGEGPTKDEIEIFEDTTAQIDSCFWFVQCQNCFEYSMFYAHDSDIDLAFSIFPMEKKLKEPVPDSISRAYNEAKKI